MARAEAEAGSLDAAAEVALGVEGSDAVAWRLMTRPVLSAGEEVKAGTAAERRTGAATPVAPATPATLVGAAAVRALVVASALSGDEIELSANRRGETVGLSGDADARSSPTKRKRRRADSVLKLVGEKKNLRSDGRKKYSGE